MPDDRGQYIGLSRGREKPMRDIVTVDLRLPWWWRPYLAYALLLHRIGIKIDPDKIADRIVAAARVTAT
jgi:hypothetical protein